MLTNAEFSKKNEPFLMSCKAAKISATSRQASKFRRGKGVAYKIGVLGIKNIYIPKELNPQ